MADAPLVIAISVDFARVEVGLVHTDGGGIADIESAPLMPVSRAAGQSYIDASQILSAVLTSIRRVLEKKPREARRVAGVGLIGRSPSVTFIEDGSPQAPFVLPADERVRRACLGMDAPWREVTARVGLTAARCEVPCVVAAVSPSGRGAMLTPKDYVKWVLTDSFSTDSLDAQRTFLWDLDRRDWSDELCRIFAVDRSRLPRVMPAMAVAGTVTQKAAGLTGLKAGLPVACGLGDWGEYVGGGVYDIGDAFEHIGTTGAFYGVTDKRPDPALGFETRPHIHDGRYLVGRERMPGGVCLEWMLHKSYLAHGSEIDWRQADEELEAAAAMGRPENVLFFPNLSDEDGAQISRGAFLNLTMEDNLTSLLQAVVEGISFKLKSVADEAGDLGWKLGTVYTTGQVGFKHAPRRIRANIYNALIRAGRMPGANIYAAALVGAVACGAAGDVKSAGQTMLNLDGGAAPDPHTSALYQDAYASWLATRRLLAKA